MSQSGKMEEGRVCPVAGAKVVHVRDDGARGRGG